MKSSITDIDSVVAACRRLGIDATMFTNPEALEHEVLMRGRQKVGSAGMASVLAGRLHHVTQQDLLDISQRLQHN